MTDYQERVKSEWRIRLAQMYHIRPVKEIPIGCNNPEKIDIWRVQNANR